MGASTASTKKAMPHRNPLVAVVMKKGVRRHGRTRKAERAQKKAALRKGFIKNFWRETYVD